MNSEIKKPQLGVDDAIVAFLIKNSIPYIDYRGKGGYIYVIGGLELQSVLKPICHHGVHFRFRRNSSLVDGQTAWVTQDILPSSTAGLESGNELVKDKNNIRGDRAMIVVSELSSDEILYICQHIPTKEIRIYFKKNPKEFTKIKPGFRASSLSDGDAIELLCRNTTSPFVTSFISIWVKTWLEQIEDYRRALEKEGHSTDESLIRALPESIFSENIDLYFKLCDETYSEDYISLAKNMIPVIHQFTSIKTDDQKPSDIDITELESDHADSLRQIEALQKNNEELHSRINQLEQDNSSLIGELALATSENAASKQEVQVAKDHIKTLDEAITALRAELQDYQRLVKYSDDELPDSESPAFQHMSICKVHSDYSGKPWLSRLADISRGVITKFERDESAPHYFDNRDRLYWKDGPGKVGFVGIWNWNADPNKSDPQTDYVTTAYCSTAKMIRVLPLQDAPSFELIEQSLSTFETDSFAWQKVLFVYSSPDGSLSGLLCNARDLDLSHERVHIKQSIYALPKYDISNDDIISFPGFSLLRFVNLGLPQGLYKIRSPWELVKEIILKRATLSALRQRGLSKKEAQHCQSFLSELPLESIYQDVADIYGCTDTDAIELVHSFIDHAEAYLNESDLDLSVISEALGRNERLITVCKHLLEEDWRTENKSLLSSAAEQLEHVRNQVNQEQDILAKITASQNKGKGDLERIQGEIAAKLQLAQDVEDKVAARIAAAKANVADFICEMAFVEQANCDSKKSNSSLSNVTLTTRSITGAMGETITDLDSFEEELTENLMISGYNERVALDMAQMISFSLCESIPVVVSENGNVIADSISAMFGGKKTAIFSLPLGDSCASFFGKPIEDNLTDDYAVIIITGVFDGYSLNLFNEIMQQMSMWKRKYCVILPLNGVAIDMIPASVWNRSVFIDGDMGIERCSTGALNLFTNDIDFCKSVDEDDIVKSLKALKGYASIISRIASLRYAKYMAAYGETLASSPILRMQLAVYAKSCGKSEKLMEQFSVEGIPGTSDDAQGLYL